MDVSSRPRVFLDVAIDSAPAGRLVIELYADKTPRTCENFRQLCTGEHDGASYAQSPFHRVIDEFMIQGGDIKNHDGTGTYSIYDGKEFDDENLGWQDIDEAGLVCSANAGKNTNGSQFFITLESSSHLNGKHTVFGRLISGQELLSKIARVPVDDDDKPRRPIVITKSGELERKRKRQAEVSVVNTSEDRGRKLSHSSDTEMQNTGQITKNRRTSDGAVDEGLRGRPRKRSRQSKDGSIDEEVISSDPGSPVKMHKRKRSSSPSRRRDTRSSERDQEYDRRRRRSLPNQHDDHRDRDRDRVRYERRQEDRGPRRNDTGRRGRDRRDHWMPYHRRREDRYAQDSGRLTDDSGEAMAPAVKFKGRGVMKYRE